MSRFVLRSPLVGLALLGVASVSTPALADVTPLRASDSCLQWSARHLPGCRLTVRHAKRPALRAAYGLTRRPILVGDYVAVVPRYASLLILGVGF